VRYLLDTNAVSALMRGDTAVAARLQRVAKADVAVPQPVLAEIAYGVARLPRSKRRDRLRQVVDSIRAEIPRAAWTDEVTEQFGAVKAALEKRGERLEDLDIAIAAHALAAEAVLVTADTHHMGRVPGLAVEDWSLPGQR
jgi:tRNA(fMet)-specific endonuclease VapC